MPSFPFFPSPDLGQEHHTDMEAGKFDSSNSDIKFQSSDGVVFNLHAALLEAHTGGFPGPDISAQGEVIQLSEPANVLALLFDFVYPKRHLDLVETDAEVVLALAEAVEKYEVFSAMLTCTVRLSAYLPKYPERIFVHAVKHGYPKLMNKAAPFLPRSHSISIMEELPACYSIPWYRYQESWRKVFEEARIYTMRLPLLTEVEIGKDCKTCHSVPAAICRFCQNAMFLLITSLEEIEIVASMRETLDGLETHPIISDGLCCKDKSSESAMDDIGRRIPVLRASNTEYSCSHLLNLAKSIQYQIKRIPSFDKFVNGQGITSN